MRKLNKKNKIFIYSLTALAIIIFVLLIIFIVLKIKETNIKYDITSESITYDSNKELIKTSVDGYIKKSFSGNYYLYLGDKKTKLYDMPVIYNDEKKEVELFGTFYEVLKNGEVNKITGHNKVSVKDDHLYKINDRRYLIISDNIANDSGTLNTTGYLLLDLDKTGNAYLYNHLVNIKTFKELLLATRDFVFDVNAEEAVIEDETIALANIIGSSNTYKKKEKTEEPEEPNNNNSNNNEEKVYEYTETKVDIKKIDTESIRKTTILDIQTDNNKITISYVAYDPFNEYESLYVLVNGVKHLLDVEKTVLEIKDGIMPGTEYNLDFYYTYKENDAANEVKFDHFLVKTSEITAEITVTKVDLNSINYNLNILGGYKISSAFLEVYVNDVKQGEYSLSKETPFDTYSGSIDLEYAKNSIIKLIIKNCNYNGTNYSMNTIYKFKL